MCKVPIFYFIIENFLSVCLKLNGAKCEEKLFRKKKKRKKMDAREAVYIGFLQWPENLTISD